MAVNARNVEARVKLLDREVIGKPRAERIGNLRFNAPRPKSPGTEPVGQRGM